MSTLVYNHGISMARSVGVASCMTADTFTFDDAVPIIDRRNILDYLERLANGHWYEPPVSFEGLAKSFRASTHHSSAIYFKANVVASTYIPQPFLPTVPDLGNAFIEWRLSRTGKVVGLRHSLAKFTRVGVEPGTHFFVPHSRIEHPFEPGSVWHLREADINQEVYGLPEYLSTLQSAWLNESATLFRRRYYNNGSHAGFIMCFTDDGASQEDVDSIRTALKNAKGRGNFRNLFLHSPNGKKDGMQIIPLSEVAAKDEFLNIKAVTRDDVLAAHRVPPQLMGIVPGNTGGFGAVMPAAQVFARNEIAPLQARLAELNAWLGMPVMQFKPYVVGVETDDDAGTRPSLI
jgi:PBSX family phage portal protein